MNHAALILASGSPRRRELLSLTGLPYVVDAPEVDESCALPPEEAVQEISRRKGLAGAAAHPGCVVLSADTLVAVDGKALGKPHSEEEAFQMLSLLSGRWHQVYTGVCAVDAQGMVHQRVVGTRVHFCPMTEEEIRLSIRRQRQMCIRDRSAAISPRANRWTRRARMRCRALPGCGLTSSKARTAT